MWNRVRLYGTYELDLSRRLQRAWGAGTTGRVSWVGYPACYAGCLCLFFFFQAEDGIRDLIVTGVQTCALPISRLVRQFLAESLVLSAGGGLIGVFTAVWCVKGLLALAPRNIPRLGDVSVNQIGRASCRERV